MPNAPSIYTVVRQGLRYNWGELQFRDFSGGLNIRDAAPELAQNESPDLSNVTLDERGGISKRLGFAKYNGSTYQAAKVSNAVYWAAGGNLIVQCGDKLYKDSSTTSFKTFTTSERCAFADFTGKLYFIHPTDGLFSYDGTTVTGPIAGGPKGSCLAVWQNELFASGDPGAKARVYKSEPGDGTKWFHTQTTATSPGITFPLASTTLTGAQTLPEATVTVASTASFAASGALLVGSQIVHYTAIGGATTFTGCTGGTGTIAASATVKQALAVGSTTGFDVPGTITVGGNDYTMTQVDATAFADLAGPNATIAAGALITQNEQNFNDLREKDGEAIVALAGAAGIDVAGRPGLLAFKRRSTYRIYDSNTIAYQTLDPQVGAASALAVTNLFERTLVLSEQGIFWTDGVGPLRPASDKITPIFTPGYADFTSLDSWCAGSKGDRAYFSMRRAGSSANDLMLEYHPLQGWITANSNAATCYATYGLNDQKLYTGSPTANGQVYEQLKGGSDDGVAITSRFQTPWIEPTQGHPIRIAKLRITGRGTFSVNPIKDWELYPFDAYSANLSGDTTGTYDSASSIYDTDDLYGPTAYEAVGDFQQVGVLRSIALQFTETSSGSSSGLQILASGTAPEIGAWGVYGIDLSYVPLGLS